ncbi:hypothetical protein QUB80_13100 [Chlorogloeopsis sp. ULAP01]|nr:hypothetical protein [Chlorogloeopsis sp. ULAP01]
MKMPAHDHPIQFMIFLSGVTYFDDVHPRVIGGTHSYFSGSGICLPVLGNIALEIV